MQLPINTASRDIGTIPPLLLIITKAHMAVSNLPVVHISHRPETKQRTRSSLPAQDLGNGVSNGNAGLLNLLLGQADGQTDLERRQRHVQVRLGPRRPRWQRLDPRNEDVLR